ncbi:hypothetical protein N0M98_02075 [Paenibacillus doosanensis]|uniref:Uncharacterized protein n=1 Tax=Paenibacillus konkukensis TaxID=2020716 RepID=A0ABY4RVW8_9BACL|nr:MULTISPECIES: hypothetical protein [Paenibacillus]MCS7458916.1 hypothetical protein [Paenibacillus doosanensis]UQZ86556.1 hypothetical protein SK3146_05849 [Paenibacillus konkukensis]
MSNGNNIPTKEIGELLEIISGKAPKLVTDLLSALYSEEAGARMGKAVGTFYKELMEAGIPADEALKMSKDYMNTVKSIAAELIPKNIVNHNNVTGGPTPPQY